MTTPPAPAGEPRPPVILASASPGRRALLARICPTFEVQPAAIDETPRDGETGALLAGRLAREKAQAIAARAAADTFVIGSDQVAVCAGTRLDKPGDAAANVEMLAACSGRVVEFQTAVCLLRGAARPLQDCVPTRVTFRTLTRAEIRRYVDADEPWQCAGGFKVESRGITLFEAIESRDPTALIGLPLIAVSRLLRQSGYQL